MPIVKAFGTSVQIVDSGKSDGQPNVRNVGLFFGNGKDRIKNW